MFQNRTVFKTILVAALLGLWPVPSSAIKILAQRGTKLLLDLEGTAVTKGDRFLIVDRDGKRRALIEVSQIKDEQAVVHVTKGKLTQGPENYTVQPLPAPTAAAPRPPVAPAPASRPWKLRGRTGFLGGFASNTVKVNLTGASSVQLTGTSFAAEGFYEATVKGRFQILLRGGLQSLKAQGSLSSGGCSGSPDCGLDVSFLGAEALGKYLLGPPRYSTWMGGGVGLLYAVAKTSNVIDTGKIGFMQKLILGGGGQYPLSKRTFIPLQVEYDLFLNSSSVNAAQIFLRLGYGWRF